MRNHSLVPRFLAILFAIASASGATPAPTMEGFKILPVGDEGSFAVETAHGGTGLSLKVGKTPVRYGYFQVLDGALRNGQSPRVTVAVRFLDRGVGDILLQYDSLEEARIPGAFKSFKVATLANSLQWKTATFTLADARFAGRCNGYDFRLSFGKEAEPLIDRIQITKEGAANATTTAPTNAAAPDPRLQFRKKLMEQLKPGTVTHFDIPYVPGAKVGASPDSIQNLDLFIPPGPGPFPLVIHIHGGGWHGGGKQTGLPVSAVQAGVALASINYRLTGDAPFPAPLEDCLTAVQFLREQAETYRLDRDRLALMGHSAGAHLCSMVLLASVNPALPWKVKAPIRFRGATLLSGPFDLDRERGQWPANMFPWKESDKFVKTFFPGGKYDGDFARRASASSYVFGQLPDLFIAHGDQDKVVPFDQARVFAEQLQAAGNRVLWKVATGADHTIPAALTQEGLQFLVEVLKK